MNLFDLSGTTAVVIGGNSTLGGTMAVALGGHGAEVAVVGRNQEKCEKVCRRIEEAGGKAKSFYADAISADDLREVLRGVLDWTGRVDTLMNCPGKNSTTPFFDISMEEWDSIMEVNLKSVVLACQIFGKHMVEKRRRRKHYQHFLRIFRTAAVQSIYLFRFQSCRQQRDEIFFGARICSEPRTGQCHYSRFLPGGAEPQDSVSRTDRVHTDAHSDGALRRIGRTAGCGCLFGFR